MAQQTWEVYTGSTAPGSTTIPNVRDALKALSTMHSGASAPSYKEKATWWYDTANAQIKWYDGSTWIKIAEVDESGHLVKLFSEGLEVNTSSVDEKTLAVNDTTPSVAGGGNFKTANTSATTILPDGASAGDRISIRIADEYTTLNSAMTRTGRIIPCLEGDTWEGTTDGTSWMQTGGNIGMGRYVPLAAPDVVGDWPAPSTSYQDVDVSDDGVRKGAVSVKLTIIADSTSLTSDIRLRINGSSVDDNSVFVMRVNTDRKGQFKTVALDDNCKFEVKSTAVWAVVSNEAYVWGYSI